LVSVPFIGSKVESALNDPGVSYTRLTHKTADMDIQSITTFLTQHVPGLQAIYQFGSQFRRDACLGRDIDLAILACDRIPAERLFELAQEMAVGLGRAVDLLDLRQASIVMRAQVISTAQCIGSQDEPARAEFECTPTQTMHGSIRNAGSSSTISKNAV
jgi:predicted nucleotidyltransferase